MEPELGFCRAGICRILWEKLVQHLSCKRTGRSGNGSLSKGNLLNISQQPLHSLSSGHPKVGLKNLPSETNIYKHLLNISASHHCYGKHKGWEADVHFWNPTVPQISVFSYCLNKDICKTKLSSPSPFSLAALLVSIFGSFFFLSVPLRTFHCVLCHSALDLCTQDASSMYLTSFRESWKQKRILLDLQISVS